MGIFKLSWIIFKREFKNYHMLLITMVFALSCSFVFFDIINYEPDLYGQFIEFTSLFDIFSFSTILGFIVVIFCAFMILNSYIYLLKKETREIAIMSIAGASGIKIAKYLVYQAIFVIIISFPIGLLIGYIFSVICRIIFSSLFTIRVSIYMINFNAFLSTIVTTLVILFTIILYSSGYIYRNQIIDLLNEIKQKEVQDRRLLRFPYLFYIIIYLFGIFIMMSADSISSVFFGAFVGIAGAGGTIRYLIPRLITKYKKKFAISNSVKLVSVSFLSNSLQRSITLISVFCIFSIVMLALGISKINSGIDFAIFIIGYIAIIILILSSIMYKFVNDSIIRKDSVLHLYYLGYQKYQIVKIMIEEVAGYFIFITLIPLAYQIIILIVSFNAKVISLRDICILFGIIIMPIIIVTIISIKIYISNIKNDLKEYLYYE